MKRPGILLAMMALVALLALPATASSRDLEQCVTRAASGKGEKLGHVKIFNHHFHCYPVRAVTLSAARVEISGRLDHDLKNFKGLRPDDRVQYSFVVERGAVKPGSLQVTILRGGVISRLAPAAQLVAAYYGVPLSHDQAEAALSAAGQTMSGRGWEEVAQYTIARIAQRTALQKAATGAVR